jgi:hypothetical protein
MKENYANNELKKLLEEVDIPSADVAWEKMSSLLDASAEGGANTAAGKSVIFKTIIWLNSIFLVLTTLVVGAMYNKANKTDVFTNVEVFEKGPLTIHLPPFTGNFGQAEANAEAPKKVNILALDSLVESAAINDQHIHAVEPEDHPVIHDLNTNDTINLGEVISPGVSIKHDEGSPVLTNSSKAFQAPRKTSVVAVDSFDTLTRMVQDTESFSGDTFIGTADVFPTRTAPPRYFFKAGLGLNRYSPPSFLLKQMQLGIGCTIPLSTLYGLKLEILYNPVTIKNQQWEETKSVSSVAYINDITARKLNYISVPFMVQGQIGPNLSLSFGVQQSYLLSKTGDVNSQIQRGTTALVTTFENIKDYSDEERFNNWNTAGIVDLEYRKTSWVFSARLQQSVVDITSNMFGNTSFDAFSNITLSAGYLIKRPLINKRR